MIVVGDVSIGPSDERPVLEAILARMSHELRTVFVLFELEGFTMSEIADLLALAPGTVERLLHLGTDGRRARLRRSGMTTSWTASGRSGASPRAGSDQPPP